MFLLKLIRVGRILGVAVEGDNALIDVPDAEQSIAKGFARSDHFADLIHDGWVLGGSLIFRRGQLRWSRNGMANAGFGAGLQLGDGPGRFFL